MSMSPASAGPLEVERYIGACLISQHHRSNNKNNPRNLYHRNPYAAGGGGDGWAGGLPLISFANHQRRDSPLARLAVHARGAPLILAKSYQHRKNKPQRAVGNDVAASPAVQHTKVFENSNNKKLNVDAISVASDESYGSQNSETCLPRIIKPRKRRKKDRKAPPPPQPPPPINVNHAHHHRHHHHRVPYEGFLPPFALPSVGCYDDVSDDSSETPQLHHSFEDVVEANDPNGNQPSSSCQCRYCDPSGQIWDVDRSCYSPLLTSPRTFRFPGGVGPPSPPDDYCLGMASIVLDDDKSSPTYSRSWSSSSSSSFGSDLEVSTEIVTSLNGLRDLEIKFFTPASAAKEKETNRYS
ncbi:uncharacterized protein LOC132701006 [Cylas formicarius]|uniref:uncharacterized protein LOC132701006 n=1 Tax=Cylas formicarius TaxID=197179 RepID=UPI002958584D|nr:uncharacterized protein LOC132701006 [Cylas formicarius]